MGGRLKTVTPSLTLLGIVTWNYYHEGRKEECTQACIGGPRYDYEVLRGEKCKREVLRHRDSLGDIKEDIKVFRAPWVSPGRASPKPKIGPAPRVSRPNRRRRQVRAEEATPHHQTLPPIAPHRYKKLLITRY